MGMTQHEKDKMLKKIKSLKVPFINFTDSDYCDGFYDCLHHVIKILNDIEVSSCEKKTNKQSKEH